jgi:hypothetical protein
MPPRKQRGSHKVLLFRSRLAQTLFCFLICVYFFVRLTGRSHWSCHQVNTHQSCMVLEVIIAYATVQEHSLHYGVFSLLASSTNRVVCVVMLHLWPGHLQGRRWIGSMWTWPFSGCSWRAKMPSFHLLVVVVWGFPQRLLWSPPYMVSLALDGCLLISTIHCLLLIMTYCWKPYVLVVWFSTAFCFHDIS